MKSWKVEDEEWPDINFPLIKFTKVWVWVSFRSKTWNENLPISLFSGKVIPITNQHTDSHPCIRFLHPMRTGHKGKTEKTGGLFCDPIPLGNQTLRTLARTNETKRIPGWTQPPDSDCPPSHRWVFKETQGAEGNTVGRKASPWGIKKPFLNGAGRHICNYSSQTLYRTSWLTVRLSTITRWTLIRHQIFTHF